MTAMMNRSADLMMLQEIQLWANLNSANSITEAWSNKPIFGKQQLDDQNFPCILLQKNE